MAEKPVHPKYVQPKKTYVLPLDRAAGKAGAESAPRGPSTSLPRRWLRKLGTVALALAASLVVGAIATVLLAPGCVRKRCIAIAAEQGVVLGIDEVRLGAGHFVLVHVTASSPELVGMRAEFSEVDVETSGIEVARLVARRGDVTVDGAYENVARAFDSWQRAHRAPGAPPPPRFVAEGMHVVWTRPFGDQARVDALEARVEASRTATAKNTDIHFAAPHVTLKTSAATLGPWRFAYDRDAASMRARIAFDPQLPDGPTALFVGNDERVTSVDVKIARMPLAALGIPPAALGLRGSEQVEATVRYDRAAPSRVDARADVSLYGLRVAAVPMPLDAKLELALSGDPARQVSVRKGQLDVGPMRGAVLGTLHVFDDGTRLELAWSAGPVPCSSFVTLPAAPPGMPPPLPDVAAEVQKFLQATGIAKVTGDVRIAGALTLDTRDLAQTALAFSPQAGCNVSLFGATP